MKLPEQSNTPQKTVRRRVKSNSIYLYRAVLTNERKASVQTDYPALSDNDAKIALQRLLVNYEDQTHVKVIEVGLYRIGEKIL